MIKSPTILTRRGVFRVGAGLAVAATATPLLIPTSTEAEDAHQTGAQPLNGNGFYRFKIGDRDLRWLWADSGRADPRYECL
jgi:hypothetical protein